MIPPSLAGTPSYFIVTSPAKNSTWINSGLNVVRWVSAKEGVTSFDLQLVRLSSDGVIPIAKTVPTNWLAMNVYLTDTPPGDDYFLMFLNSEDSSMYSISPRFMIFSNGTAATGAVASNNAPISTVTVSGAPNPTMQFAQTFAVSKASTTWGSNLIASWAAGVMFAASMGATIIL